MASLTNRDVQVATNGSFGAAANIVAQSLGAGLLVMDDASDFVTEVASLVETLGTTLAQDRIAALTAAVDDLPEQKSGGWGGRGPSGGAKQRKPMTGPASPKQVEFVTDLAKERGLTLDIEALAKDAQATSDKITELLATPKA